MTIDIGEETVGGIMIAKSFDKYIRIVPILNKRAHQLVLDFAQCLESNFSGKLRRQGLPGTFVKSQIP